MEDEAKLRFFTGPLPGWEAGRRVPVNVIIEGAREGRSTFLSPPLLQLRTTTSEVPLRKSNWDSDEKGGEMVLDRAMQVPLVHGHLPGNFAHRYVPSPVETPRNTTTSNFGVIGDGRYEASSLQKDRHLVPIQPKLDRQSSNQQSNFSSRVAHLNPQAPPKLKEDDTGSAGDPFISQDKNLGMMSAPISGLTPPNRRSQSFGSGNPWASSDSDSLVLRRVSKPVVSLTASFTKQQLEETRQPWTAQTRPSLARSTIDFSTSPLWKRKGPSLAEIRPRESQIVMMNTSPDGHFGSRFDPDTFSLPFGVSFT